MLVLLPNCSGLGHLYLTGVVPDWLFELPNLRTAYVPYLYLPNLQASISLVPRVSFQLLMTEHSDFMLQESSSQSIFWDISKPHEVIAQWNRQSVNIVSVGYINDLLKIQILCSVCNHAYLALEF